ncbi:carboxyl transferase domain-containing protein, partial [Acinetobacter baumannii]|nr:carboxyl transferase domain-containing protein [Acinetobacter baumannii]
MTARERVLALLDEGSFVETDALAKSRSNSYSMAAFKPVGDGVVTGYGTVDGRSVCVFSADATVLNGTVGEVTGEKIVKILDLAIKT